jgi:hypothetical protein
LAQGGDRVIGLVHQLPGPGHGHPGQAKGELLRQAGLDTGLGQGFDQEKDVSRPAARDRGHRIQQRLVLDPGHLAHRRKQLTTQSLLACRHLRAGAEHGHAPAHRRRGVGHGAHHRGLGAQVGLEGADGLAGGDRQEHGFSPHEAPVVPQGGVDLLGLDGDHHHGRLEARLDLPDFGGGAQALGGNGFGGRCIGFNHYRLLCRQATVQPAGQQGTAHLAAAHQKQGAVDGHGVQASPRVSIRATEIACSTEYPPHSTSCSAG